MLISLLASLLPLAQAQVTATFPNGETNPDKPSFEPVGSIVNQTSLSRLLSLNGVDDFCLWGPIKPGPDSVIGNVEPEVVAYCTKPRNGARLIPDGAITAAHFIKTPLYVQIYGFWDGTKANIPYGDAGGELDPHGAEGTGNPIGGNVTSDVEGKDVFYEEWMSFISFDQFCLRVCTAEEGDVTAALECEHELDTMGCAWVMAIEDFYQRNNSFTSCEGEAAAPPGLYPQSGGGYSTFRQRYTGTFVDGAGQQQAYTVGNLETPAQPAFFPKTSNCVTYSTISNGIDTANYQVTAAPTLLKGSDSVAASGVSTISGVSIASKSSSGSGSSGAKSTSGGGSARPTGSASGGSSSDSAQNLATSGAAGSKVTLMSMGEMGVLGITICGALLGAVAVM